MTLICWRNDKAVSVTGARWAKGKAGGEENLQRWAGVLVGGRKFILRAVGSHCKVLIKKGSTVV